MIEKKASIHLNFSSGEPIVEQIRRQLLWQIASGQYQSGERLPSIRKLAKILSINLHTVRQAYQRLETDGIVQTRQGYGTQVLELDPQLLMEISSRTQSNTIGVIVPGLANPFFPAFLQGVEKCVSLRDLLIFACDAHDNPQLYFKYISQLAARNVDGIIISSFDLLGYLDGKFFTDLPIVTADWPGCPSPSVSFDLTDASRQAVDHLLSHGHRRIGLITFEPKAANVEAMNIGYAEALQAAGIHLDEDLIARMPSFLSPSGAKGIRQLLALDNPPTAIFTIGDMLALDVLEALRNEGVIVPGDLAIASMNDIPSAKLVDPPLTTVSLPVEKLGYQAAQMLLNMIDGVPLDNEDVKLPGKLVVRQSCGCNQ